MPRLVSLFALTLASSDSTGSGDELGVEASGSSSSSESSSTSTSESSTSDAAGDTPLDTSTTIDSSDEGVKFDIGTTPDGGGITGEETTLHDRARRGREHACPTSGASTCS